MTIDILTYAALALFIAWITLIGLGEAVQAGMGSGRTMAAGLLALLQLLLLFGGAVLWGPLLLLLGAGLLAGYALFYLKRPR